jgi:type IV pilus assembly protein PilC
MMGFVVPAIVGFIQELDQVLPWYTAALIDTSEFFRNYWYHVIIAPVLALSLFLYFRRASDNFKYHTDSALLKMPIAGNLLRKITIARYAQTFSSLFAAGIGVLDGLKSARQTVGNLALHNAVETVEEYVKAGNGLSDSLNACGEFPSMVVRMVKVGEESGSLTPVLEQVSDFYTKDVDEAVEGLVTMIEPMLTALLGGIILWIAAGVFGPIYSSFENIDF